MMKRLCRMAVSEFLSVHSNIEGRTLISYFIDAKSSVYGRFGSSGLEEWVRTKTVTFKN
jgi:hypothetical protein